MTVSYDYMGMLEECRAIMAEPLSDTQKTEACLGILQSYVRHLALTRARQPNPPLRFYADMEVLRRNLLPHSARDDFGQLVIVPLFRSVDDWLRSHWQEPRYHPEKQDSQHSL